MSDEAKCCAATPAATLEKHITDSNLAKNEAEWWAHHEITRLRDENARLRAALKALALKAPVQLTCDGGGSIQAIIVRESELNAARAVIWEGGEVENQTKLN